MFLDGFVFADRLLILLVSVIVVVSVPKDELLPRISTPIPAVGIVAISAGCESAMVAAKDVNPTLIPTDLTVPWIHSRSSLVAEVIVVTVDPQSLPKLC